MQYYYLPSPCSTRHPGDLLYNWKLVLFDPFHWLCPPCFWKPSVWSVSLRALSLSVLFSLLLCSLCTSSIGTLLPLDRHSPVATACGGRWEHPRCVSSKSVGRLRAVSYREPPLPRPDLTGSRLDLESASSGGPFLLNLSPHGAQNEAALQR